jgi:multicomponent Na+:H+ antiporter subunit G
VDNLGLGLLVAGLLLQAPDGWWAGKVLLVWVLALLASAVNAYLIANSLRRRERDAD